jgi:hypothetical protein
MSIITNKITKDKTFILLVGWPESITPEINDAIEFILNNKNYDILIAFPTADQVSYGIHEYDESVCNDLIVVCCDKNTSETYHMYKYDEKVLYKDYRPTEFPNPLVWDNWTTTDDFLQKIEQMKKVFNENANF